MKRESKKILTEVIKDVKKVKEQLYLYLNPTIEDCEYLYKHGISVTNDCWYSKSLWLEDIGIESYSAIKCVKLSLED